MTSFNHYALGAVADWMHRTIGGLTPAEPGYRKILIRPCPGGALTSAKTRHLTPYGTAEVAWERNGNELSITALVPTGTTAIVDLPTHEPIEVGPGRHNFFALLDAG